MSELLATSAVNDIDKWIERLYDCKPLTEAEVKLLCEQVSQEDRQTAGYPNRDSFCAI